METYTKRKIMLAAVAASLVAAGSAVAQQVTMTLNSGNVESYAEVLPSQTLPDNATWTSGGIIGVYQFTVSSVVGGSIPGLAGGDTFWSTCLSPGGELDYNSHTYNYESFQTANPGINPSAWATSSDGTQLWGIQNANYLWKTFGSSSTALQNPGSSPQDAGAALAMAMYVALYDSTGYGSYSLTKFDPTGLSTSVQADMTAYLNAMTSPSADIADSLAAGYMLVPQDPNGAGSGQEFIILAPEGNNVVVPEPGSTSVFGGLIALFAVVGGTVRRKFASRGRQGFCP
jgi:hypothetical protein